MYFGFALVWALVFGVGTGVLNMIRPTNRYNGARKNMVAAVSTAITTFLGTLIMMWIVLYFRHPALTAAQLWPWVLWSLLLAFVVSVVADFACEKPGASISTGVILALVFGISLFNINGDVNNDTLAKQAAHLVNVVEADQGQMVETDTNHIVVVSDDIAAAKANQDMGNGEAGTQGYNTYYNLGPATLQSIGDHMYYAFQLVIDGMGNKHYVQDGKLKGLDGNLVPGYFLVDAEDPDAPVIQRVGVDKTTGVDYRMTYTIAGGQAQEVERYVYSHGWSGWQLSDATLEVDNSGKPFITLTAENPVMHWGYSVPQKLLVVDPQSGEIKSYALDAKYDDPNSKDDDQPVPDWVDRVYSASKVSEMMTWWGLYDKSEYHFGAGRTNGDRYKVVTDPVLRYSKSGHPEWVVFMSSLNSDTSVYRVVMFDARAAQAKSYTPGSGMGVPAAVIEAFQQTTAGNVKNAGYTVADLSLHKIYGHLTWLASYKSAGDHPTFVGIGLAPADKQVQASGIAFGKNKGAALGEYQTLLASSSDNSNPTESGQDNVVFKGTIASKQSVVEGGQTYVYLVLAGPDGKADTAHIYRAPATVANIELIYCEVGDPVTVTYLKLNEGERIRNIRSFDDGKLDLQPAATN